MSPPTHDAAQTYRRNAVLTASPEKLVVLLYDGALRLLDQADRQLEQQQKPRAHEALSRAFAIVSELRSSLDPAQGGDLARDLERLYVFAQGRILAANRECDRAAIAEARRILATLKEGWDGILRPA